MGPAATDFTNVGVQDMMKLYYCERKWPAVCSDRACSHRVHSAAAAHHHMPAQAHRAPALLASPAARLFPHQEMYKWLAYGNGAARCLL